MPKKQTKTKNTPGIKDIPTDAKQKQNSVMEGGFTWKHVWKEYIEPILVALVLALFIRTFIFQPFRIPSGSMEDTLLIGDFILANKFIYGAKIPLINLRLPKLREPRQKDIIVFKYPKDPTKDFIKRCVAVGGQTIEIHDKHIFVDGKPFINPTHVKFENPYIIQKKLSPRDNFGSFIVPENSLFMMGDNRDNSNDSRFWGVVPIENVVGKASIVYWSWTHEPPLWKIPIELFKREITVRWGRIFSLIR